MSIHVCGVPTCGATIHANLLMCGSHWRRVPRDVQSRVYVAWRKYQKGTITIEELRKVQAVAIDAVKGVPA